MSQNIDSDRVYKLCFYVPLDHAEAVKAAVFDAGAGRIGDYHECCFQWSGTGQFRPMPGSNPYIGQQDALERVAELKVEMICRGDRLEAAVAALRDAHPYEEPALEAWPLTLPRLIEL